jgi:hypothetical protein
MVLRAEEFVIRGGNAMHRVFQDYLNRLEGAGDRKQLRDAMSAIATGFELHSFAYLAISKGRH